jgi:WD40 repeat protein
LWNVVTGAPIAMLTGHTGLVDAVAFSPDGKTIGTTSSYDGTVRLWNVVTGAPIATLTRHAGHAGAVAVPVVVRALAFSPDGETLATTSFDHTAQLSNAVTGAPIATLTGHTGAVEAVAFSPVGKTLATTSDDGTARLWNGATGAPIATLTGHTSALGGWCKSMSAAVTWRTSMTVGL